MVQEKINIFGKIYSLIIKFSKILSRKGLYSFLKKEFSRIKMRKMVLNIGSGGDIGELLNSFAKKNGFNVLSMDISQDRSPDIVGDICSYDFGKTKFDTVVMSEVLEHVTTPILAIKNIHNILIEGGELIITTPFIFPIHDRPNDYYRYTIYGLKFLLKDFKEVRVTEKNSWTEAINILALRMLMEDSIKCRLIAPFFVILAFIKFPFVYLLGKIIDTNFITTGYNVIAIK